MQQFFCPVQLTRYLQFIDFRSLCSTQNHQLFLSNSHRFQDPCLLRGQNSILSNPPPPSTCRTTNSPYLPVRCCSWGQGWRPVCIEQSCLEVVGTCKMHKFAPDFVRGTGMPPSNKGPPMPAFSPITPKLLHTWLPPLPCYPFIRPFVYRIGGIHCYNYNLLQADF